MFLRILCLALLASVPLVWCAVDPYSLEARGAAQVCQEPKEVGPCKGGFARWYFNFSKKRCIPFIYGGCQGNDNNFEGLKECIFACY